MRLDYSKSASRESPRPSPPPPEALTASSSAKTCPSAESPLPPASSPPPAATSPCPSTSSSAPAKATSVYSTHEQEAIRHDIQTAKSLGASGVVLGALTAEGPIDSQLIQELIDLARPMSVTFHRAFDLVPDPSHALETLISLGVDRVLTSGQAPTAREGQPQLRALIRQASSRIIILAAGSINVRDIHSMIAAGLREIHVGSAAGPAGFTDTAAVRSLVNALRPTPPGS